MKNQPRTRTWILAGVAVTSLMAGAACADDAITDTSRAAERSGDVQGDNVSGGTNAAEMPGTSDSTRAATEGGNSMVNADTAAGVALGPKADPGVISEEVQAMTVNDLIGKNVLSATGEDIGEVDHVIAQNGQAAIVVGVGGFLGMGEHDVAIPLSQFGMTADGALQLDSHTEAELKSMPDIDENNLAPLDGSMLVGDIG